MNILKSLLSKEVNKLGEELSAAGVSGMECSRGGALSMPASEAIKSRDVQELIDVERNTEKKIGDLKLRLDRLSEESATVYKACSGHGLIDQ